MLNVSDNNLFADVATSILESVADALEACQRDVPDHRFVGFDRPPEDTCPDLVAWVDRIRPWDGESMDGGLNTGRLMVHNAYAFDVTIRLGRCYIDFGTDGKTLDTGMIEDWSKDLYRDGHTIYIGWVGNWRAGLVSELSACDPLTISSLQAYKQGGCAGWEFTITVGVM